MDHRADPPPEEREAREAPDGRGGSTAAPSCDAQEQPDDDDGLRQRTTPRCPGGTQRAGRQGRAFGAVRPFRGVTSLTVVPTPTRRSLSAWSDSEVAEEQFEEDQDQLGGKGTFLAACSALRQPRHPPVFPPRSAPGLPAYDDVLDLIILDLDDDDLGDDDVPAAPQPTSPTWSLAVMPTSAESRPPALPAATAATAATADSGPSAPSRPANDTSEYYTGLGKRLEQFAPLAVPMDPLDPENQGRIRERLAVIERFRAQNAANAANAANAEAAALARQDSGTPICRICRDTYPYGATEAEVEDADAVPGAGGAGSLVSPCECRGTVARVHMTCLERWLAESDSSCCELCGHQYTTIRTPSYSVLASIPAWVIHTGSVDLLFDIVAFIIFTPVTLFGTHLLGVNADDAPYFQVSIMAALDLVYSAWLAMRLHYHANRWYSWWRRKSTVKVILDREEKKNRQTDS
ncbi:uncharacterized protein LOC117649203 [Thrips palmi]|uniref:Uncharacterized protein LOC117649203 n=1 Tax=Thrips palmi TaxID=161013 RepID=A0A6P8Z568_THRPL|nr:uncharacterized protein LOC117649203 [Thrips palmi]